MTLPLFFLDQTSSKQLPSTSLVPGQEFELSGEQGRHAVTVKRTQPGEQVLISDGAGSLAQCEVCGVRGKDALVLQVQQVQQVASGPDLTVVLGMIKGDRMERAVEQLTEIGVTRIVPWASERSVISLKGDARSKIQQRLQRKAFEAAKQSRRPFLPEITSPVTTTQLIEQLAYKNSAPVNATSSVGSVTSLIVLHESAQIPLSDYRIELPKTALTQSGSSSPETTNPVLDLAVNPVLVVGPEGGITEPEISKFEQLGAQTWRMGPTVMRAGTAAVVAATWLLGSQGYWKVAENSYPWDNS